MDIRVKVLVASLFMLSMLSAAGLAIGGDLRLVEAVRKGDKVAVRSLLNQHVDVNASEADGATALMWAAQRDDLDVAELLIRAGANVSAANENGATALGLACANASARMVEKLLKAGANPNIALVTGETPLMTAAATGNQDVVKMLLATKANANALETRGGQTALMWALAEKHPEAARALIENGADVHARSKGGYTPLLFAAQQGDLESARNLLAAGADVNEKAADGMTPLLLASASGHEELSVFLLNKGGDPNAMDRRGLSVLNHAATAQDMPELVKALLARGVNPNSRFVRSQNGGFGGPRIGATSLLLAAEAGNVEAVRVLVANGADPQIPTNEGTTPLMIAAGVGLDEDRVEKDDYRRALEIVKILVGVGADVNAIGENGWTALHGAAYGGDDGVIQFLVEHGAKMDVMDKYGQTPLSIAEAIITVGLGDDAVKRPCCLRKSTSDLLLKMGATPLEASGVKIFARKNDKEK